MNIQRQRGLNAIMKRIAAEQRAQKARIAREKARIAREKARRLTILVKLQRQAARRQEAEKAAYRAWYNGLNTMQKARVNYRMKNPGKGMGTFGPRGPW